MSARKLVIFDCDGTLVDSQNAIVAAMDAAFEGVGLRPPSRAQTLSIVGLSLPEAFAVLAPDQTVAVTAELVRLYKGVFPAKRSAAELKSPLFPGTREIIADLAQRDDVVLGIATGKSRRGVVRLLDQEGWHDHFLTIQTADDHPSKPHPSMVLRAMGETGAGPGETVMVGDTTYDMEMGRAAGAGAIGVAWGYHPAPRLTAAGAQTVITAFADLPAAIARLLARAEPLGS
ncbi:MAG: HAD-IA family hydrolase [Hyphomicrobiaceae bacterium]